MKKAILLLLTLGSIGGASFAQQRSLDRGDGRNNNYQQSQFDGNRQSQFNADRQTRYGDRQQGQFQSGGRQNSAIFNQRANTAVYNQRSQPVYGNRISDRQRQVEIDRINRDYDSRISGFRNNRSMNSWERNSRINGLEQQRSQSLKTVGGALLGAVIGGLIGHSL